MKNNHENNSAGTDGRRSPIATAERSKLLQQLQDLASLELVRAYPDVDDIAASGYLHAGANPNASAAPVVCAGNAVSVWVPLRAKAGVLLPLLQDRYRVVGHSPAENVLHLRRRFRGHAAALRAFAKLCSQPLPAPVMTSTSATTSN